MPRFLVSIRFSAFICNNVPCTFFDAYFITYGNNILCVKHYTKKIMKIQNLIIVIENLKVYKNFITLESHRREKSAKLINKSNYAFYQ